MHFLICSFILSLFALSIAWANQKNDNIEPHWQIQPKACIVESKGDECELKLEILMPELKNGVYCYFANQAVLQCFKSDAPPAMITISFSETTILSIRQVPAVNNTISTIDTRDLPAPLFSQTLEIRTRKSSKQVRRVRDPWSLF